MKLKSISELSLISLTNETIEEQLNILSNNTTAEIANVEVSYQSNTLNNPQSYKFDFGKFINYVVSYLTMLSNNFDNYLPTISINNNLSSLSDYLVDEYLPDNYVTIGTPQNILSEKVFSTNISCSTVFVNNAVTTPNLTTTKLTCENTAIITDATITDATITDATITNSTIKNNLTVNNAVLVKNILTCEKTAQLTAQHALWT